MRISITEPRVGAPATAMMQQQQQQQPCSSLARCHRPMQQAAAQPPRSYASARALSSSTASTRGAADVASTSSAVPSTARSARRGAGVSTAAAGAGGRRGSRAHAAGVDAMTDEEATLIAGATTSAPPKPPALPIHAEADGSSVASAPVAAAAAATAAAPAKRANNGQYYSSRGHHSGQGRHRNNSDKQQRRNIDNGLTIGQRVVGRVVWANEHGAKVDILDSPITGYMPTNEAPCLVRDEDDELASPAASTPSGSSSGGSSGSGSGDGGEGGEAQQQQQQQLPPCVPIGLVREFEVVRNDNKRGPLLSARAVDWELLWARGRQLYGASLQERENVRVRVVDVNGGGLLARLGGLQLFVPVSQLEREGADTWWSEEQLRAQFTGAELEVAINEIDPSRKKFVGSVTMASENRAMRQIKVGSLVWGTVRRVEPFGAFVGIDGTHVSGLVHISNISRSRVRNVDEVFAVGDRVHSLVMGIDEGYTNISLSTAELEVEDGDMLRSPADVYEKAPEQQAYFLEHLGALREALEAEARADAEREAWGEHDGGTATERADAGLGHFEAAAP